MKKPIVLVTLLSWMTLAACAGSGTVLPPSSTNSPRARIAGGAPQHVAVVLMENHEFSDIIGSAQAPYTNRLAKRFSLARRTFAITHPSLPNYLALSGGSTAGISSDCADCSVSGTGLAGQFATKAISWKAYMEDLPHACFKGTDAGNYAKRHDPFVYYRGIASDPALCGNVVPLTQLAHDEQARRLPRFIWITPNLCHDMHDCDVRSGDRFLAQLIPPLLHRLGHNGLLILTWDEGSSNNGCCRFAAGGHVATILAGPGARRHGAMNTPVDHYSVLRVAEDLLGLPRLGNAGCACTPSLAPLLRNR